MMKTFLIFLVFLGFLATHGNFQEVLKMMKIFGKVSKANGTNVDLSEENIDEDCEQTCFDKADCILAFFNEDDYCILFDFNSTVTLEVVETTRGKELYVSFKTTLPNNTCPAYDYISLLVNMGEDPIYWTRTGTTWNFQKCVGNWKMFPRTNQNPVITVCMQTFSFPEWISKLNATAFCEGMGRKLTGLASVAEAKWINAKLFEFLVEDNRGFWMDGVRACVSDNATGLDCKKNFAWYDDYTTGTDALGAKADLSETLYLNNAREDCLAVGRYREWTYINDVSCSEATLQLGVVCGYRMD